MGAEARYFCPECGGMELAVTTPSTVVDKDGLQASNSAVCQLCGWEGTLKDTLGAVSSEEFYDIEKVGNILLRVVTKHASGPLCQALELVGIIRPGDEEGRAKVLRAAFEGCITGSFEAAAGHYAEQQSQNKDTPMEKRG